VHEFPHHYTVSATGQPDAEVTLTSDGVAALPSDAPVEFGGPGGHWSPESLLVAAVADCFVLSFRAIARASRFEWLDVACEVTGDLDRVERVTQFTAFHIRASLTIPAGADRTKAERLLEKSEAACLITNSLKADSHLKTEIRESA